MQCVLCKNGHTEPGKVTVTLEREGSIVLLKDVPAHICINCGNYFLDSEVAKEVLQKGEIALKNGAELEVIRMKAA